MRSSGNGRPSIGVHHKYLLRNFSIRSLERSVSITLHHSGFNRGLPRRADGIRSGFRGYLTCLPEAPEGTNLPNPRYQPSSEGFVMRTFFGMILGALLLTAGVYVYDSMQTSSVANGQVAQETRTIVNWDVAASNWNALKTRAHDDWIRISAK